LLITYGNISGGVLGSFLIQETSNSKAIVLQSLHSTLLTKMMMSLILFLDIRVLMIWEEAMVQDRVITKLRFQSINHLQSKKLCNKTHTPQV